MKKLNKFIIGLMATLLVFGAASVAIAHETASWSGNNRVSHNHNNISFNGGVFHGWVAWGSPMLTGTQWGANTMFSNPVAGSRTITVTEMRNNATGALLTGGQIVDRSNSTTAPVVGGNMAVNRIIFSTHEYRASNSIVRFGSVWRN